MGASYQFQSDCVCVHARACVYMYVCGTEVHKE